MARSKTDVIDAICRYGQVLDKVFCKFELRLYGSYHRGSARDDSDIDVAVICDEFAGIDYILSLQILNRLKLGVDLYVEPVAMTFADLLNPLPGSLESYVSKDSEVIYRSTH